jgi:polyisoprenoid-binding protein YceI
MKSMSFSTRRPATQAAALASIALAAGIAACTTDPQAGASSMQASAWTINSDASDLRFVTTKNTNVAEVQQFKHLSGQIDPAGKVTLVIDLASVETQIPIRNERLQSTLFEVAKFPTAQFEGNVDMKQVQALEAGASLDVEVAGKLGIHGQTQDANASLRVVRLKGDRLLVTTRAPILVNAAKYDMASGIEKLRELMGLPNIIGTVPVSFALVFQKQA